MSHKERNNNALQKRYKECKPCREALSYRKDLQNLGIRSPRDFDKENSFKNNIQGEYKLDKNDQKMGNTKDCMSFS